MRLDRSSGCLSRRCWARDPSEPYDFPHFSALQKNSRLISFAHRLCRFFFPSSDSILFFSSSNIRSPSYFFSSNDVLSCYFKDEFYRISLLVSFLKNSRASSGLSLNLYIGTGSEVVFIYEYCDIILYILWADFKFSHNICSLIMLHLKYDIDFLKKEKCEKDINDRMLKKS